MNGTRCGVAKLKSNDVLLIQQAIRERALRAVASKKPHTVSDTVGHTKRFAETALGGPAVGTGSTRAANPVTVTATIGSAGGQPNSTATAGILPSAVVKPLLQARVLEDKATDQGSGSQVSHFYISTIRLPWQQLRFNVMQFTALRMVVTKMEPLACVCCPDVTWRISRVRSRCGSLRKLAAHTTE